MQEKTVHADPAFVAEVNKIYTDRSLSRMEAEKRVKAAFGIERIIGVGSDPDLET
jgi:hypothetical protein